MSRQLRKLCLSRITFITFILLLTFYSGCSKKISESRQQYIQDQTREKQKLQDSLLSARENEKSDMDKNYILLFKNAKEAHNMGEFSEAINLFTQCLKLNPDFAEGWGWRGVSKLKSGNGQGACEDWAKSVELGATKFQNILNENCH